METKGCAVTLAAQKYPFPVMTVGIMGSAGGFIAEEIKAKLRELGRCVARRGYVLITGAAPGMPHETVLGAFESDGIVVGVSPALNLEEHVTKYLSPTRGYRAIVFTGSGLMGREIENIRSCDVVIFAGGRSGTLGEFSIAFDEGKIIGILKGTGGITDHLSDIIRMIDKNTGAIVTYDTDPENLLGKLEELYKETLLPQYTRLMEQHNPDGTPNPE
ncbi:hypothetical protein Dform_00797 [Dehalogenimonas formicexedens]|uniref:TIGR00725 family protein n=1 Tax=Dehalogenimonas formicexedens TaxID=1839801 RepID=A0A1P8F6T9_9CHLR|nr:LOG family protein [Dehalogenimonas formicexedens]APV44145.1 hypothetical protein Dform_00797 [Dehalogenimonas formicexedens]